MNSSVEVTKVMSMSLNRLVNELEDSKFLLPALQRVYTWKWSQIETLFDSLMRGYPINTMMFWDIDKLSNQSIDFYKFLSPEYVKGISENESLNDRKSNFDGITRHIVIDGQQRITSLYIGMSGSYNKKKLCLRLDCAADSDDREGMVYDFRFLTMKQFEKYNDEGQCWVMVSEVRKDSFDTIDFIVNNNLRKNEFARNTLEKLKNLFSNTDVISYYSIAGHDNIDDVLDIFVRTNSGGTKLTKGDLLLSSFTTDWATMRNENGRKYVEDIINDVEDQTNFVVSKDWVLKSFSLMVSGEVKVSVGSFKKLGVSEQVYDNKEKVASCIVKAFSLVKVFGLVEKGLTAKLAVMPIAYYLYAQNKQNTTFNATNKNKESYYAMRQFVFSAILQQLFQSQTDQTLMKIKKAIDDAKDFSFDAICHELPDLRITDKSIAGFMGTHKKDSFPYLNIVYALAGKTPDSNTSYDVDHIHPDKLCQQYMLEGLVGEEYDTLPNLQLMSKSDNRSKNAKSLVAWTNAFDDSKDFEHWKNRNFIPEDISFEKESIKEFLSHRGEMLKEVFERLK